MWFQRGSAVEKRKEDAEIWDGERHMVSGVEEKKNTRETKGRDERKGRSGSGKNKCTGEVIILYIFICLRQ